MSAISPLYNNLQQYVTEKENTQEEIFQVINQEKVKIQVCILETNINPAYPAVEKIKEQNKKLYQFVESTVTRWQDHKISTGLEKEKVAKVASQFLDDYQAKLTEKEQLFTQLLDGYAQLKNTYQSFFSDQK